MKKGILFISLHMSFKDAALRYLTMGFAIIPLKPKTKIPLLNSWSQYQITKPSIDQVVAWWEQWPEANIGIICGKASGLVVVDVDTEESSLIEKLNLAPTPVVKTGKGFHYYYRLDPKLNLNVIKFAYGEIRGNGGYVVAPPSIHPTGSVYEWTVPIESVDELTNFDSSILTRIAKSQSVYSGVSEGGRNIAATKIAGNLLGKFATSEWLTKAWPELKLWNSHNNPPLSARELYTTFQSIARRETSKRAQVEIKTRFQIVTNSEMLKKETKPFPYIVDKLVPEKAITSITADSGKGKSLFALALVKSIATGTDFFEFPVQKQRVLIIDQEMNEDLIVDRYKAIVPEGADIDYMYGQSWSINEPEEFEWLIKIIEEREYGLVVFDTLTTIHSLDENQAKDMRELNKYFLQLINETGVTIVYLHHHRKPQRGEKLSQSTSRGSTEIMAKVASHLLLDSKRIIDEQGRTVTEMTISQEKARRPESISTIGVRVIFDPETKGTQFEYRGAVEKSASKIEEAKALIIKELEEPGRALSINDMKSIQGIGGVTAIRTACASLVEKKVIDSYFGTGKQSHTKFYFLNNS